MLKSYLTEKLNAKLHDAIVAGEFPTDLPETIELSEPKSAEHGDFMTNFALANCKLVHQPPREFALQLLKLFQTIPEFEKVEIAGPGFINFVVLPKVIAKSISEILEKGTSAFEGLPRCERINVEFVSVNPNGPITVASGRGAAYGDSLCRILKASGFQIDAEYYINDALNSEQMRLFTESVRFYLAEFEGLDREFPENGYKGDYVREVAQNLYQNKAADSNEDTASLQSKVQDKMILVQKQDLEGFRVSFQTWFSEQSMHDGGDVTAAIEKIKLRNLTDVEPYRTETVRDGKNLSIAKVPQSPGPLWLRSHQLGDDKDRVLIRADGRPAYIAGDLAYMENKLGKRKYDKAIIILGPDHHGYIPRLQAVCKALGYKEDQFEVIIYQIVRFVKDGRPSPMHKRDGNIYELKDLVREVGVDAARFFYLMRSHETHMDFDIDLATKKSDDNPVFYAQYAHARICSIFEKATENGIHFQGWMDEFADGIIHPQELALILKVNDLKEEISRTVADYGVHRIATYAVELARTFHSFYQSCKVIDSENPKLTLARLAVCNATKIALAAALDLLGVEAPLRMDRPPVEIEPTAEHAGAN